MSMAPTGLRRTTGRCVQGVRLLAAYTELLYTVKSSHDESTLYDRRRNVEYLSKMLLYVFLTLIS